MDSTVSLSPAASVRSAADESSGRQPPREQAPECGAVSPTPLVSSPLGLCDGLSEGEVATARAFASEARAAATKRAYASDWRDFESWCAARGASCLPAPAELLAVYLADLAKQGRKVATIARRVAAIREAHRAAGFEAPESAGLRSVLAGIRRSLGTAQKQARPISPDDLRSFPYGDGLEALRNRALFLVGFSGAFRRSELAGLLVSDLGFCEDGLIVTVRRSKTDQAGAGRQVGLPYASDRAICPVRAARQWLEGAGLSEGPFLREVRRGRVTAHGLSGKGIARIVARVAPGFSGHSLRAGFATSAAKAGADPLAIARQTGHRSLAMVGRYVRVGTLFEANAASKIK